MSPAWLGRFRWRLDWSGRALFLHGTVKAGWDERAPRYFCRVLLCVCVRAAIFFVAPLFLPCARVRRPTFHLIAALFKLSASDPSVLMVQHLFPFLLQNTQAEDNGNG